MDTGFDRGIDFETKKKEFIKEYQKTINLFNELHEDQRYFVSKKRKIINRIIYLLVSMLQLINGSRISEACNGIRLFIDSDLKTKVIVKIAKSESTKTNKEGKQYKTKIRHRALVFPYKWIDITDQIKTEIIDHIGDIPEDKLKKRVLDYLLLNHECNTHSLRYAYINYMLYTKKKEPSLIAKHVGHANLNQIVRYTQNKEADKLFDEDI